MAVGGSGGVVSWFSGVWRARSGDGGLVGGGLLAGGEEW
jgi:hypothetical protein